MRKNASFSVLSFKTFSAVPTLVYRSALQVMSKLIKCCQLCTHIIVCLVFVVDFIDRTVTQSDKMNVCIIEYV